MLLAYIRYIKFRVKKLLDRDPVGGGMVGCCQRRKAVPTAPLSCCGVCCEEMTLLSLCCPVRSCSTQESEPCFPGQHRRADTVGRGPGELALRMLEWDFWPHPKMPCGRKGKEKMSSSLPCHLYCCNTQESGPCTSPGQHSRADSIDRGTGEPAPRM